MDRLVIKTVMGMPTSRDIRALLSSEMISVLLPFKTFLALLTIGPVLRMTSSGRTDTLTFPSRSVETQILPPFVTANFSFPSETILRRIHSPPFWYS